jgi:origin recognition complex subunit 4
MFDQDERQIEQQLGFKDIGSSTKKKTTKATTSPASKVLKEVNIPRTKETTNETIETREESPEHDDDEFFDTTTDIINILSDPANPGELAVEHDICDPEDDDHITDIKSQVLSRLTSTSEGPITYLEKEYTTLHTLLSATITAGESNSLLLLGSRGSGKTLLVEHALSDLSKKHTDEFHTVRLSGFFQTDDRLALREIWRQLGREMAVPEDETGEVSSYADTMASLLSLLSHPEELDDPDNMQIDSGNGAAGERTAKSVVFVLDEFDLFTTHPRQTLLYNLFDIAQAKKAPIAVLGCSTRMDVVDCLEKRVKSRFSHRWLHVPAMKSLHGFEEAIVNILCLATNGKETLGVDAKILDARTRWNDYIKVSFCVKYQ